jgi:uncharacterized protein (TIGR00730 family)
MARDGIGLVCGGASEGLMGMIADAAMAAGGEVIAADLKGPARQADADQSPQCLGLAASRSRRLELVAKLSDGFVVFPGGLGDLEDLFEVMMLAKRGEGQKPFALYNIDGFYDGLIAFLLQLVASGFLPPARTQMHIVAELTNDLLAGLRGYRPALDVGGLRLAAVDPAACRGRHL